MSDQAIALANNCDRAGREQGQRRAQYLYNILPDGAQDAIVGGPLDPFYKNYTIGELAEWIDDHLIFDDAEIIAVFDGDAILWDRDDPDMAVPAIVRS